MMKKKPNRIVFIFVIVILGTIIVYSSSKNIKESFIIKKIISNMNDNNNNNNNLKPPAYFTSCGEATQYGCETCLNAVISNASSVKCGWNATGHRVNGREKQYICESGGKRQCPNY